MDPDPPVSLDDRVGVPPVSLYDSVGGGRFFAHLVDRFYEGVEADPVVSVLYPEAPDFTGARHRLTLFLIQYWGGPTTYSDERGHPRLRMRHLPFTIGPVERDHWLTHMRNAVAEAVLTLPGELRQPATATLLGYFEPVAEQMRNDTGLPISSRPPTQRL